MSDKAGKESQYIVSRLEPGSDPPFGSDRESERDRMHHTNSNTIYITHENIYNMITFT